MRRRQAVVSSVVLVRCRRLGIRRHAGVRLRARITGLVRAGVARCGRPHEIEVEGFRIVVEQMARRRVLRVHFERMTPVDEIEMLREEDA